MWLGRRAAAGWNDRTGNLGDRCLMRVPVPVVKPNQRVHDSREPEIVDPVKASRLADCVLRRLHVCVVVRPAAVVLQIDSPAERTLHDGRCAVRVEATEMNPQRQDEGVPREAMAALMGRDPQLVLAGTWRQRTEDRGPTQSAALVAAPVAADEDEPLLHEQAAREVRVRKVLVSLDLDPTQLG